MTENKVVEVISDKFFEDLDDVRMESGDFFDVVEKMEVKCGRKLSRVECEWIDEMVGWSEEEVDYDPSYTAHKVVD